MMTFHFAMILAIILSGAVGYRIASNDLLQQVFLSRKLSHRLTEFICVALILVVLWALSPSILVGVVPVLVSIVYVALCLLLRLYFKRWPSAGTETLQNEIVETALRTATSVFMSVGIALLVCLALSAFPAHIQVTTANQHLCHAMLLGVAALLLMVSGHYLFVLRLYPNDHDTPSRALLKLRKELRRFPQI